MGAGEVSWGGIWHLCWNTGTSRLHRQRRKHTRLERERQGRAVLDQGPPNLTFLRQDVYTG